MVETLAPGVICYELLSNSKIMRCASGNERPQHDMPGICPAILKKPFGEAPKNKWKMLRAIPGDAGDCYRC